MLSSLSPTLCTSRSTLNGVRPCTFQGLQLRHSANRQRCLVNAKLGGGKEEAERKGFITADEEPDEFFLTKAEQAGGLAPLKDPIAIVGILGILLPFVILGIAIGTGYVDVSPKMPKY